MGRYRSVVWNDYHRPANIDDRLTSVYQTSDTEALSVIALHRRPGEPEFSQREEPLLRFFHREFGRLIRRSRVYWRAIARSRSPHALASVRRRLIST